MSAYFKTDGVARRRRHHGAALARIAAGLGQPGRDGRNGGTVSQALWRPVHGQRHQRESLVGQRVWRRDETEQVAGAAGAPEEEDHGHQRPLQQAGGRDGHSPRTDRQPAVGRADSEGTDRPVGDHDGPGPRQPRWPGHAAVQHRAGVRTADDRVSRDEFLDGVQLAHFVAERGFAGAQRGLSLPGVRQPVREPRQPAQPEHPGPGQGTRGQPRSRGQRERQSQTGRVPDQRARGGERSRIEPQDAEPGRRRAAPSSRWTARRTGCRKTSGSTRG